MYSKFKELLETIEHLGEVKAVSMSEKYANIEFVDDDGKSVSVAVYVKEDEE